MGNPSSLNFDEPSRLSPIERDSALKEIRDILSESNLSSEAQKISEVRPLIDRACRATDVYPLLWQQGKKNFMKPEAPAHPVMEHYLKEVINQPLIMMGAPLSVLDLGSGAGKNSLYLMRNSQKKIFSLRAIDTSRIATALFRHAMEEDNTFEHPNKVDIQTGDFQKEIRKMAAESRTKKLDRGDQVTDVLAISSLYFSWEHELRSHLIDIKDILQASRGRLVAAFKTPQSDSKGRHRLLTTGDYKVGIDFEEGIMRAYIEPKKISEMMDQAGFDMVRAQQMSQTVDGYDRDGEREQFHCVITQPKA